VTLADSASQRRPSFLRRIIDPRILRPLAGIIVPIGAGLVVYHLSRSVHVKDVVVAINSVPLTAIASCIALTIVSFAATSLYDVISVRRAAPGRVSPRFAALASVIGYAIANAVGVDIVVGGAVRYRLYARAGLDAAEITKIIVISASTFVLGLAAVAGLALVLDPAGLPFLRYGPVAVDRLLGVAIIAALLAAIVWLWRTKREISVRGWQFPLPHRLQPVLQIAVGATDIAAAIAALYVLMPPDILPGFAHFVALFIVAIALGAISHLPGGLGVFEATVLIGLGAGNRLDAIAALLLFRVIYFVLPLALAITALVAIEIRQRARLAADRGTTFAKLHSAAPPMLATLTFLGGLVLLLSGTFPAEGSRIAALRHVIPLPFVEASHLLASLAGLFLIVLAHGLHRRIAIARTAAIILLIAGAVFSLAKGLDWEEAVILAVITGLLAIFADSFYRKRDWTAIRPSLSWLAAVAIALMSLVFIGVFVHRAVAYRTDLWWQFAWHGDASRFLRATFAIATVAAAITLDALINRPSRADSGPTPIPPGVRDIVARSRTTGPALALVGDKRFVLDGDGKAFIMYGIAGRSWITIGDPVGDREAGRELIWRFVELVDNAAGRPVFCGVSGDFLPDYLDLGLSILKLGEVANVDLNGFSLSAPALHDLRYADRRAARDGFVFSVIPRADVAAVLPELRAVSDAWLAVKTGREKGFIMGRFDPDYVCEFDCAVMRKDGKIVAFANLMRGADKHEISPDLMRYQPGVSSVLMKALFVRIILYSQSEGYRWFYLGAAPLTGLSDHPLASTWNRVGSFFYQHADEIFSFEGLRAFKQQFSPIWTPLYLACHGGISLPRSLFDIASLVSGGPVGIVRR